MCNNVFIRWRPIRGPTVANLTITIHPVLPHTAPTPPSYRFPFIRSFLFFHYRALAGWGRQLEKHLTFASLILAKPLLISLHYILIHVVLFYLPVNQTCTAVLSKKSEDFTRNFLIARYHGTGSVRKRVIEYLLINYRHDRNKFAILYFERSIPGNFLSESSNELFDQGQF